MPAAGSAREQRRSYQSADLIGNRGGRGIAPWARNPFHVTVLVDGLPVFVGSEIDRQIYGLAAKHAGYFWESMTSHSIPLWTVTNSLRP